LKALPPSKLNNYANDLHAGAERGILTDGEPPLPWCAGRQIALPDTSKENFDHWHLGLRCFGSAGNFILYGNLDQGNFSIQLRLASASTATLPAYPASAGYGAGHFASLAADMHGDTETEAAAKP
jgi:hypothetical protein